VLLRVGTSGWQYRSWRGAFYPRRMPQRNWLSYYALSFGTIEVNSTFYRLPSRDTVGSWASQTPEGFLIVVKASRYLTHVRRLADPEEPVTRLLEVLEPLGPKRGPILLQLPPDLRAAPERLDRALACFPPGTRVAVELRHSSWFTEETWEVLRSRRAAFCLADRRGPLVPVVRTAPWAYLRMHEGRASPSPCYGRTAIESWVSRLSELWTGEEEAYVFFNNDERCCAVRDARLMKERAIAHGVPLG
jgi:uncharacterized protein YecE (DUF72 family)